jgi:hypothetical protein
MVYGVLFRYLQSWTLAMIIGLPAAPAAGTSLVFRRLWLLHAGSEMLHAEEC